MSLVNRPLLSQVVERPQPPSPRVRGAGGGRLCWAKGSSRPSKRLGTDPASREQEGLGSVSLLLGGGSEDTTERKLKTNAGFC